MLLVGCGCWQLLIHVVRWHIVVNLRPVACSSGQLMITSPLVCLENGLKAAFQLHSSDCLEVASNMQAGTQEKCRADAKKNGLTCLSMKSQETTMPAF